MKASIFTAICILMFFPSLAGGEMPDDAEVMGDISLGELLNLEVTVATKTAMAVEEAPSIVSVITGEEIENMGARNIVDVLRTVPGFDLTYSNNTPGHIMTIRGIQSQSFNRKVKIMIDGHSMQAMYFSTPYDHFRCLPIAGIKQIEIIRGPGSALYGTGAFLGAVNIITKDGGDEPSKLSFEGGSHDTIKPSGELSYKKGDWKIRAYAHHYETEGHEREIREDFAGKRPIFESSAPGPMNTNLETQNLNLKINHNDFYFAGFFQKLNTDTPAGVARVLTDEDDLDQLYSYAELGYKMRLSDRSGLNFRAFYDYAAIDHVFEIFPEETSALYEGFAADEGMYGEPQGKWSVAGGEIMSDYEVWQGIQLVGGVSCEYYRQWDITHHANYNLTGADLVVDGVNYPRFPYVRLEGDGLADISENGNYNQDADRTVYAMYAQGMFDFKKLFSLEKGVEALSLTAGVRYDDYSDFGNTANPRFGLVYAPVKRFYFKALYGTAFRAPDTNEMYVSNNPSGSGNPDLNPETITTMEFLAGCQITKHLSFNLTYFNVEAEDLVQRVNRAYVNIGRMESNGVEGEFRAGFDRHKYGYVNFTWQEVRDTTNLTIESAGGQSYSQGDYNPGSVPEIIANAGVNYDLHKYVLANVWVNYTGERDRSEQKTWSGDELVPVDGREPVKERFLTNISLTFANFAKGLELRVSGYNVFDVDHRDPEPSGRITDDLPGAGRTVMGKISYSF